MNFMSLTEISLMHDFPAVSPVPLSGWTKLPTITLVPVGPAFYGNFWSAFSKGVVAVFSCRFFFLRALDRDFFQYLSSLIIGASSSPFRSDSTLCTSSVRPYRLLRHSRLIFVRSQPGTGSVFPLLYHSYIPLSPFPPLLYKR